MLDHVRSSDLRATLVLSQAVTSLSCPHLYPAISSSRRPLASHKCLRLLYAAPLLPSRFFVLSAHCSRRMMKRVAWLLLVRARAVSQDQAQKRKMRKDDDMYQGSLTDSRAPQQTRDLRNKGRQTDKSRAMVAAKGFAIRSKRKNMDDNHMRRPSWLKHMARTISRSSRMQRPCVLDHPRSLLDDDAPAVGQSTCTKWTGLDSRAIAECRSC
jgi:hypothetical protein